MRSGLALHRSENTLLVQGPPEKLFLNRRGEQASQNKRSNGLSSQNEREADNAGNDVFLRIAGFFIGTAGCHVFEAAD